MLLINCSNNIIEPELPIKTYELTNLYGIYKFVHYGNGYWTLIEGDAIGNILIFENCIDVLGTYHYNGRIGENYSYPSKSDTFNIKLFYPIFYMGDSLWSSEEFENDAVARMIIYREEFSEKGFIEKLWVEGLLKIE